MPPQKLSKETLERIEEDNTIVLPTISQKAVKRVMTKPKTEAQMEAMRKALAKRKELLAIKKEEQAKQQVEEVKQKEDQVAKRKQEEEALIKLELIHAIRYCLSSHRVALVLVLKALISMVALKKNRSLKKKNHLPTVKYPPPVNKSRRRSESLAAAMYQKRKQMILRR